MPGAKAYDPAAERPVYQVAGKSFIFFRTARPDAVDAETGQRFTDVIVFWVPDEGEKQALVRDESTPFFTTPHFDGHLSVLLREAHLDRITVQELAEVVEQAWMCRAGKRAAAAWLRDNVR